MSVKTGLDVLLENDLEPLAGKKIGVVCNQATVDSQYHHIYNTFYEFQRNGLFAIKAVFGPQHGLWGHTQDNMIEWEGAPDPVTGIKIFSLYGEHRKPTPGMLEGIDLLVIDLPDIGTRYYTFIWTMALCFEACEEQGIEVMVLDRPNPIDGEHVEGSILQPEYNSFVGLYPLPQRHGMTLGEIAQYLQKTYFPKLRMSLVKTEGWKRNMLFPETGTPWVMPSPNMPTWETALVYPGMCLFEATNVSEGRGTTRPFEMFGASWISGQALCRHLNELDLPGVYFRPIYFLPTFHKFQDEMCEGAFIHVTDTQTFKPVLTAVAILKAVLEMNPTEFRWNDPPYEYEYKKMPIDILAGNSWLREMLGAKKSLADIENRMNMELNEFSQIREQFLIYD